MSLSAVIATLLALAVGYALLLALLYGFQRRLLFFARGRTMPAIDASLLPKARALGIETSDKERLGAWIIAPADQRPVLVYLPGALDNLSQPHRQARFAALTAHGLGLLAIDYRGYGVSTGAPSAAGFHRDARAAYEAAARRFGPERLVLYGESMGTVLATALALEVPARALVLEAPMVSMTALVARLLPFVPVRALMKDVLETDRRIGAVRIPLLIAHGARDRVVPMTHGLRLFALARAPKRFVQFERGNHVNLARYGLGQEVEDFLAACDAGTLSSGEMRRMP